MSHKYTPDAIAANDRPILEAPALGGNKRVYFSHINLKMLATITLGATANDAAFVDNPANALADPYPDYLAMRLKANMAGTGDTGQWPTVTLDMTDNADLGITRAFTWQAPPYVKDQSRHMLKNMAVDSGAPAASELIKALDGTVNAQNYVPTGAVMEVWELPDLAADWIQVGCTDSIEYPFPDAASKSIQCGMDSTAFTTKGLVPEKTISGQFKFFNSAETRIWGKRGSMLVEVVKDDLVVERQVFGGVYLSRRLSMPDGESEAVLNVEGKYEDVLVFSAL